MIIVIITIYCLLRIRLNFFLQESQSYVTRSDGTTSNSRTTKVFVWGLNDKDQLGGLKGSKVKYPVYSEVLSSLKPVYIAGGSKSLFVVSYDGKVCIF